MHPLDLPRPLLGAILCFALLPACDDKGGDDTGPVETDADTDTDTDTDTDIDTDTDTDTDTDSDTDADYTPYTFDGELDFSFESEDGRACDATLALTGTTSPDYVGACPDCDFVFQIESTVTRDDGNEACDLSSADLLPFSFYTGGTGYTSFLAFASSYYYDYYSDVLQSGIGLPDEGYPGPYLTNFLAFTGDSTSPYGTASFDGSTLSWSYNSEGVQNQYVIAEYLFKGDCAEPYAMSEATASYPGEMGGADDILCESTEIDISNQIDVWELVTDGGTVQLTADTVAEASAGDLSFYINDTDTCTLFWANDQFGCSFPPASGALCASLEAELEAGTYAVVVESWGSCSGSLVEYDLVVGGDALSVVLIQDDLVRSVDYAFTLQSSGSGTVTPAE